MSVRHRRKETARELHVEYELRSSPNYRRVVFGELPADDYIIAVKQRVRNDTPPHMRDPLPRASQSRTASAHWDFHTLDDHFDAWQETRADRLVARATVRRLQRHHRQRFLLLTSGALMLSLTLLLDARLAPLALLGCVGLLVLMRMSRRDELRLRALRSHLVTGPRSHHDETEDWEQQTGGSATSRDSYRSTTPMGRSRSAS